MKNKQIARIWSVLNAVAFSAVIVVNYLANALPLNGKTTGELSDAYPNLFVPAGITFAVWGVIYLLLACFVVYSLIVSFAKEGDAGTVVKMGPLFFMSCLFNGGWIFAWHWQILWLSVLLMAGIFCTLLLLYLKLKIGIAPEPGLRQIAFHLPFSVYLGWITVASIANLTALLVDAGWKGWGLDPQVWTVTVMAVAVMITLLMLWNRRDPAYAAVVFWAFLGIYIKRSGQDMPADGAVEAAAAGGLILIAAGIVAMLFFRKKGAPTG